MLALLVKALSLARLDNSATKIHSELAPSMLCQWRHDGSFTEFAHKPLPHVAFHKSVSHPLSFFAQQPSVRPQCGLDLSFCREKMQPAH
jgi:hypothetical protein